MSTINHQLYIMLFIKPCFATLSAVILFSWFSCSDASDIKPNNPPVPPFSFSPENADTLTIFTFDASASTDLEDVTSTLLFKWDFEGKSNWTEAVNDPVANYKYSKSGTYEVGLKVIDSEGWSGEARKDIIVRDSV